MTEPGPIDVDVNQLKAADLARMLVSRAVVDETMAWAEIGWDAMRYQRIDELTVQLVGFIEQLLAALAAPSGKTSAQLWREMLLAEAVRGETP